MILAGINFGIHWKLIRGDIRPILKDSELKTYLGIFLGAVALITVALLRKGSYPDAGTALRYAAFNASSILTTTGFATADYLAWPMLPQTVLFSLMFIGGCSGSTGGGLKVSRIVTLFKMGLSEMRYLLNPRGVYGVFVDGRYLKKNIVYDIAAMVYLFALSVVVSTLVVASGGYDILTSLTSTLACIGNIGPGFGLVGPAFNYSFFPGYIKAWLSFTIAPRPLGGLHSPRPLHEKLLEKVKGDRRLSAGALHIFFSWQASALVP
jgi:trk system potassium uptake protein TrkH